ncbi:GntR family transcriptional regulator [Salipiger sp. 1_MG-2023]|uniref:GntR family transcriptional regulator n=1 Tax=Salipiger sp. 1_MG-2023 TaxID=3062665 RepID=UPI0026E46CCE|nr:GntR family transcriptional regulator [Salipiger sp. 1_MG-2023]MDO6587248.1 GntR family transcriptional regulator [Salipiger sp. 1_MG-2023]
MTLAFDMMRQDTPMGRPMASSRIYDDLRQRILSLDLPPGTALTRADLAREYDVSQTPLRDAMQRLDQDGLIRIYPQSKTLVTRINLAQIREALFLRQALETEVTKKLTRDPPPETLARLREVIALQRAVAPDKTKLRRFQELDEFFHYVMFEGAGHPNLHALLRAQTGDLDRVRRLQTHSSDRLDLILQGHERIVAAIESGDVDDAVRKIRRHTHKPDDWADEYRARHEDYFT